MTAKATATAGSTSETTAPTIGEPCSTCAYWNGEKASSGQCRRYPPQILPAAERRTDTRFPMTAADDWCGEHAPA